MLGDAIKTSKSMGRRSSEQFAAGQRTPVAPKVAAEQHPMTKFI